jgi:hypothetical protein
VWRGLDLKVIAMVMLTRDLSAYVRDARASSSMNGYWYGGRSKSLSPR